ncbi:hypothetical protein EON65_06325 [archaeon]|nr:MAG: hypothetical protein EON65_06325 [archaeon]
MAFNPISSTTNFSGPLNSNSVPLIEKLDVCVNYLASSDPKLVIKALNFLVARTADGFDGLSNVVQLTTDHCPRVIIALGELLDVINPMGKIPYRDLCEQDLDALLTNFSTPVLTFDLPTNAMDLEFKVRCYIIAVSAFLHVIIAIFSFLVNSLMTTQSSCPSS